MRHEDFSALLSEVRRTFLRRHCQRDGCGGKIYRYHFEARRTIDDNGSEAFVSQVRDCCDVCENTERAWPVIQWPLANIDIVFQRWELEFLTREEFDAAIDSTFHQHGARLA